MLSSFFFLFQVCIRMDYGRYNWTKYIGDSDCSIIDNIVYRLDSR